MMHACVAPYKIASLYEGLAGRICGHVLNQTSFWKRYLRTSIKVYLTSTRTSIDGIEKSASCHECDSASGARPYVPVPISQFFKIA
jgi:hypothetical protein